MYSEQAYEREIRSFSKRLAKAGDRAEKDLNHLRNQVFACQADAESAAEAFGSKLRYHDLDWKTYSRARYAKRGRPAAGTKPDVVEWYIDGTLNTSRHSTTGLGSTRPWTTAVRSNTRRCAHRKLHNEDRRVVVEDLIPLDHRLSCHLSVARHIAPALGSLEGYTVVLVRDFKNTEDDPPLRVTVIGSLALAVEFPADAVPTDSPAIAVDASAGVLENPRGDLNPDTRVGVAR